MNTFRSVCLFAYMALVAVNNRVLNPQNDTWMFMVIWLSLTFAFMLGVIAMQDAFKKTKQSIIDQAVRMTVAEMRKQGK